MLWGSNLYDSSIYASGRMTLSDRDNGQIPTDDMMSNSKDDKFGWATEMGARAPTGLGGGMTALGIGSPVTQCPAW